MRLVVASASPRRHHLLAALGLAFDVEPAAIDEAAVAGDLPPPAAVLAVAIAKAEAVPRPDAVVLTADTIVVIDDRVLGKPADAAEARSMLGRLRGRAHRVLTAVAVTAPRRARQTAVAESTVSMRAYAREEVEAYVGAGGGLDKAGAYGIQDATFDPVETITGCWCNVMGLPLWTAWRMLGGTGLAVPGAPGAAFARCAGCPLRSEAS